MSAARRARLPAVLVVAAIVAACAYIFPKGSRQPLLETSVWSLVIVIAFAGWGEGVRRLVAPRARLDLGLRVTWGASAMAFVGASLMTMSWMSRAAVFPMVFVGVALAIVGIALNPQALRRRLLVALRFGGREKRLLTLGVVVALVVALHYLAGIAEWHTNPYDDDIAYLPFVKKLLDTGAFPEPFSFRRLSAMGGQTFFLGLVWVRADAHEAHTFDRSICVLMVVLLLAGYRERGRRVAVLALTVIVLVFLLTPSVAINTGSYYSGVVFFLGLFRTLAWLGDEERSPWRAALPVALVAATTCTLRQNFLPIPAFVLGASYLSLFLSRKGRPWKARLAEPATAACLSALALLPWLVATWQSNRTFLYPMMLGTYNKALGLQSSGLTFGREFALHLSTFLEGVPFRHFGLFALALFLIPERRGRRPLLSFAVGSAFGFLMLVHGLSQSDYGNIGRYLYGFTAALALAVTLVIGSKRLSLTKPGRLELATGVVTFALMLQLSQAGEGVWNAFYRTAIRNIDELAHHASTSARRSPPELPLYTALEDAMQPGLRAAVLLDEPFYLDFARNPIWNLDMPGYSSPAPGIPFFLGSERIEQYLRGLGVRYLAFVKPEYSRYHYRREYWVEQVTNEWELWRSFTPYLLDFMKALEEIAARHRRPFEQRGLVLVDLEAAP